MLSDFIDFFLKSPYYAHQARELSTNTIKKELATAIYLIKTAARKGKTSCELSDEFWCNKNLADEDRYRFACNQLRNLGYIVTYRTSYTNIIWG